VLSVVTRDDGADVSVLRHGAAPDSGARRVDQLTVLDPSDLVVAGLAGRNLDDELARLDLGACEHDAGRCVEVTGRECVDDRLRIAACLDDDPTSARRIFLVAAFVVVRVVGGDAPALRSTGARRRRRSTW